MSSSALCLHQGVDLVMKPLRLQAWKGISVPTSNYFPLQCHSGLILYVVNIPGTEDMLSVKRGVCTFSH